MSDSPSRVPPDQSGTTSPAAIRARSGSRWCMARVTWVSRVPIVKTSTLDRPTLQRWARRSRESAYELIDPDTSMSMTTRREWVPRRRHSSRPGSPIRWSWRRRVRRASISPRCHSRRRDVRRRGSGRRREPNSAMSAAFSAGDIWATSRWRSTSVALADARSTSASRSPSPSPPCSSSEDWTTGGACGVTVGEPGRRWVNQLAKIWSNRAMSSGLAQRVARPAQ